MEPIEDLLRRYRPAGPPDGLRDRVLGRSTQEAAQPLGRRRREWLFPFAAAVAAVVFYVLASTVQRDVLMRTANDDVDREKKVAALTADFGGDDVARLQAERVMRAIDDAIRESPALPMLRRDEVPTP